MCKGTTQNQNSPSDHFSPLQSTGSNTYENTDNLINTPSKTSVLKNPAFVMLASVFLFSLMVLCVKMASSYYTNFEIISFRGIVGVICLLIYQQIVHGHGLSAMKTQHLGMQMWRAFIGTLSMTLWFYGIARMPLANTTTISYMSSIWIALFILTTAMITGKSKPDTKLLGAIMLGFLGIVVMLRPGIEIEQLHTSLIVLLSSVFTALAYLQVAALGKVGEPEHRTVFYFCLFGIIWGLAATWIVQGGFSPFSWKGMLWMIPIGITATIAQLCLTYAYSRGNPLVNASLQYMGLVFVTFFDWIIGYGWPDSITCIGIGLVVLSGLSATLLRSKAMRRNPLKHKSPQ